MFQWEHDVDNLCDEPSEEFQIPETKDTLSLSMGTRLPNDKRDQGVLRTIQTRVFKAGNRRSFWLNGHGVRQKGKRQMLLITATEAT